MNWLYKLFPTLRSTKGMKIALLVGHSRRQPNGKVMGGAVSVAGDNGFSQSEWLYNTKLASLIQDELEKRGYEVKVWNTYEGTSYTASMRWVAEQVEDWGADAALELHFNAASPRANGHEWLYHHKSDEGKLLAFALNSSMMEEVSEIRQRGIKPKRSGDRGFPFLNLTHCPAVITEPFFGTNERDWRIAVEKQDDIAYAIAEGVDEWAIGKTA